MVIRNIKDQDVDLLKTIKPSLAVNIIDKRLRKQSEKEVEFLILEDANTPISFVLLKWKGKSTHPEYPDIEDLYTKEDCREKGYGTLLIKECEKRTKEKGFNKIGLAVNPTNNIEAKTLYEKLGYSSCRENTYLDGIYNGVEDWVIDLEKVLT